MKSAEEIMNILGACDLTGSLRDAAELAGCSHHTVARYVREREQGTAPGGAAHRVSVIDPFLEKLEELVDRSKGKIRADRAHEKITAMGYAGSERTTRRVVAEIRRAYFAGRRRVHRPWVPEPGMWAQDDFGDGPLIGQAKTTLFCLWLAWSRFRVVIRCWTGPGRRWPARSTWRCGGLAGAGLPADRQREDGDGGARGRAAGAQPGGGGLRAALRADHRHLRAV